MKSLDREKLRQLIKLEMKQLMDEDALFFQRDIPGDGDDHANHFQSNTNVDMSPGIYKLGQDSYEEDPEHDTEDNSNNACGVYHDGDHDLDYGQDDSVQLITFLKEACGCEGDPENLINKPMMNIVQLDHNTGMEKHHKRSSYMAKPQLSKIAKYASLLHDMIGDDEQLDDWQESHIAQLSDDIGEVFHSLEYKKSH